MCTGTWYIPSTPIGSLEEVHNESVSGDPYGYGYPLLMRQPYPTAVRPAAFDREEAEAFGGEMAVRSLSLRARESDLSGPQLRAGEHDGRLGADDARPFGRSRERRTS